MFFHVIPHHIDHHLGGKLNDEHEMHYSFLI